MCKLMKILLKTTPFLILIIFLLILGINILMTEMDGQQWEFLIVLALFGISIVLFIADLILKRLIKNWSKILIIEFSIIILIFGFYHYQNRPLIFVLPNNFSKEYVTVIYNVDKENKLGINDFMLWKKVQVPENGIIFTSSNISETLPRTEFKTSDGEYFNSQKNKKIFIKLSNSKIEQDGNQYELRTWRLGKGSFMITMGNDFEEYKAELKSILKKKVSK